MRAIQTLESLRFNDLLYHASLMIGGVRSLHLCQYIKDMYGIKPDGTSWSKDINHEEEANHFGKKCLVARRLLERGVRFVQIWSGCDNGFPRRNWDSHEDINRDHGPLSYGMAVGASALIKDLKQRLSELEKLCETMV